MRRPSLRIWSRSWPRPPRRREPAAQPGAAGARRERRSAAPVPVLPGRECGLSRADAEPASAAAAGGEDDAPASDTSPSTPPRVNRELHSGPGAGDSPAAFKRNYARGAGGFRLFLGRHLLLGFVPGADLQAAAHPAQVLGRVRRALRSAHHALRRRGQLVGMCLPLGLGQDLARDHWFRSWDPLPAHQKLTALTTTLPHRAPPTGNFSPIQAAASYLTTDAASREEEQRGHFCPGFTSVRLPVATTGVSTTCVQIGQYAQPLACGRVGIEMVCASFIFRLLRSYRRRSPSPGCNKS